MWLKRYKLLDLTIVFLFSSPNFELLQGRAITQEQKEYYTISVFTEEDDSVFVFDGIKGERSSDSLAELPANPLNPGFDSGVKDSSVSPILLPPAQGASTGSKVVEEVPTSEVTIKALEKVTPSPVTVKYQQTYDRLKALWKSQVYGKSEKEHYKLFFQQDEAISGLEDENDSPEALSAGALTEKSLQALMFRFLIETPTIDIPNEDKISVISAKVMDTPDQNIQIDHQKLKETLIDPALKFFTVQNKNTYANIVKVEGKGGGKYVVVVIEKNGKVYLIDPSTQQKTYHLNILSEIVKSLNSQKPHDMDTNFHTDSEDIVYTGIQGASAGSTSSGIYAFTYWASIMSTDALDAFERINGADSEETTLLQEYDSIKMASVYSKKLKKVPGLSNANNFELDIRKWLREELVF